MKFNLYNDVKLFYRDTCSVLLRHETQNMIPLGNVIIGNEGKDKSGWRDPANWFMATVTDETGILLTAIMTPPYGITLYATDNKINDSAISCLIDGLLENNRAVCGVTTEKALAKRFAEMYCAAKAVKYEITMSQRIYELKSVKPGIPDIGGLRLARESDMPFLPYWIEGFNSDCFGTPLSVQPVPESYLYEISAGRMYILEDKGIPVTMTKITRETQNVCGIGYVYTPPYFRKRGYATACVAAVSRIALGRGFNRCALYTDLANPTSNSIYQKIGYEPVCDSLYIKFEQRE